MNNELIEELQLLKDDLTKIAYEQQLPVSESKKVNDLSRQFVDVSVRLLSLGNDPTKSLFGNELLSGLKSVRLELENIEQAHDWNRLNSSINRVSHILGNVLACVEPVEPWPKK